MQYAAADTMHAGKKYTLKEFLLWTRRDSYWLIIIGAIPTALYARLDVKWIAVPWVPIALIGTAAAFIVGFRNNATYQRLWEARMIWGAIVNSSRAWGTIARDFIDPAKNAPPDTRAQLIHRQIAWLTALRYQLRQPRAWETMNEPHNVEYRKHVFEVPELTGDLSAELRSLLSTDEHTRIMAKSNRATQLLAEHSAQVAALLRAGVIDTQQQVQMQRVIGDLFDHQGRCERIKNFPYPRQFATINLYFVRIFMWLLPLGMLNEFHKLGNSLVWLTIPFTFIVGWVFNAMEKVGVATENPFEGGANDIPMTSMARTIEIDLREMLDEKEIPAPIGAVNNILM